MLLGGGQDAQCCRPTLSLNLGFTEPIYKPRGKHQNWFLIGCYPRPWAEDVLLYFYVQNDSKIHVHFGRKEWKL